MNKKSNHYHEMLIKAIGVDKTTELIHGHAVLGFYSYLNFQLGELLEYSTSPSMDEIFALLVHHPDTEAHVIRVKEQASLEKVLTLIEDEMSRLDKQNMELLGHSEENLAVFKAMLYENMVSKLESWKESITR